MTSSSMDESTEAAPSPNSTAESPPVSSVRLGVIIDVDDVSPSAGFDMDLDGDSGVQPRSFEPDSLAVRSSSRSWSSASQGVGMFGAPAEVLILAKEFFAQDQCKGNEVVDETAFAAALGLSQRLATSRKLGDNVGGSVAEDCATNDGIAKTNAGLSQGLTTNQKLGNNDSGGSPGEDGTTMTTRAAGDPTGTRRHFGTINQVEDSYPGAYAFVGGRPPRRSEPRAVETTTGDGHEVPTAPLIEATLVSLEQGAVVQMTPPINEGEQTVAAKQAELRDLLQNRRLQWFICGLVCVCMLLAVVVTAVPFATAEPNDDPETMLAMGTNPDLDIGVTVGVPITENGPTYGPGLSVATVNGSGVHDNATVEGSIEALVASPTSTTRGPTVASGYPSTSPTTGSLRASPTGSPTVSPTGSPSASPTGNPTITGIVSETGSGNATENGASVNDNDLVNDTDLVGNISSEFAEVDVVSDDDYTAEDVWNMLTSNVTEDAPVQGEEGFAATSEHQEYFCQYLLFDDVPVWNATAASAFEAMMVTNARYFIASKIVEGQSEKFTIDPAILNQTIDAIEIECRTLSAGAMPLNGLGRRILQDESEQPEQQAWNNEVLYEMVWRTPGITALVSPGNILRAQYAKRRELVNDQLRAIFGPSFQSTTPPLILVALDAAGVGSITAAYRQWFVLEEEAEIDPLVFLSILKAQAMSFLNEKASMKPESAGLPEGYRPADVDIECTLLLSIQYGTAGKRNRNLRGPSHGTETPLASLGVDRNLQIPIALKVAFLHYSVAWLLPSDFEFGAVIATYLRDRLPALFETYLNSNLESLAADLHVRRAWPTVIVGPPPQ